MAAGGKRSCYTIAFKLQVVDYAKEHGNRQAARVFGPPPTEKMIRVWRQQEDQLKSAKKRKHNLRCPAPHWPELEVEIETWVVNERNSGRSVSTKIIINEARKLAEQRGIQNFAGTEGWCYRFMKRQGLSMRTKTSIAQKMPADYEEKTLKFHSFVINARKKTCFELGQIGNMDEVPLTFDVPSNRTVTVRGSKTVSIKTTGHEKTHYTVALACCADGTKLPPFLIFKRKTQPKDKIPRGVFVHVHEKGWMDENGLKLWLQNVWSRRPGGLLRKPSLLVWDQFRAHRTAAIKKKVGELKTQLALIPGGLTSQLQPLDVSVNKPFKQNMREHWNKWMTEPHHDLTPTGQTKRPTIAQVCEWVNKSWDDIRPEIIVKSFKKCGISNALDGTEDDALFEDSDSSSSDEDEEVVSGFEDDDDFSGFEDDENFSGFEDDENISGFEDD